MPRAELAGKRMAIHARKLALEPDLQTLRRHRRPLLRRLEQAHRSALADHVARTTRLGPWVLITESWYYMARWSVPRFLSHKAQWMTASPWSRVASKLL